jgi:hypothetical protein
MQRYLQSITPRSGRASDQGSDDDPESLVRKTRTLPVLLHTLEA